MIQAERFIKINNYDSKVFKSLQKLILHIEACCDDKYKQSIPNTLDTIYSNKLGEGFNIGNALKYIGRYNTTGYSKSGNQQDLLKAIHYLLFEIGRLDKNYLVNVTENE